MLLFYQMRRVKYEKYGKQIPSVWRTITPLMKVRVRIRRVGIIDGILQYPTKSYCILYYPLVSYSILQYPGVLLKGSCTEVVARRLGYDGCPSHFTALSLQGASNYAHSAAIFPPQTQRKALAANFDKNLTISRLSSSEADMLTFE